jgi:hypothetical protein
VIRGRWQSIISDFVGIKGVLSRPLQLKTLDMGQIITAVVPFIRRESS